MVARLSPDAAGAPRTHEVLDSETPFAGKFFQVLVEHVRLPNGKTARRDFVRHPGAAAVVPLRRGGGGDEVLLVRQNRHAVGADLLEIPAGKLDVHGESAEACARRELLEETGFTAEALEPLGVFFSSPGFTDERYHLFVATGLTASGPPPDNDDGEPISAEWLPLGEAVAASGDGRIVDAKTALGLALVALREARA